MTSRRLVGPFFARRWPCVAALGLLAGAAAGLLALALRHSAGRLVYPLDDAYIHMALARTLAGHGVWGVSASGFSSCSSSLLWPLLLALGFRLAGARDVLPLLLNAVFAAGVVVWLAREHARRGHPAWYGFLSLVLLIALTPLPSTLLLGMEHVLHALLTVVFAGLAASVLAGPVPLRARHRPSSRSSQDPGEPPFPSPGAHPDWRDEWTLLLLAPLLAMVRYEAVFLLAAACFLFLCRRRWRFALALGCCGLAPLVVFGCLARARGFHFFPNSVLIKAGLAGAALNFQALSLNLILSRTIDGRYLLAPFVAVLLLLVLRLRGRRDPWESGILFSLLYLLSFVPQYLTYQPGPFCRYDAYLAAFGLAAFFINLPAAAGPGWTQWTRWTGWTARAGENRRLRVPRLLATLAALGVPGYFLAPMVFGFAARAYYCPELLPPAAGNIYEQQYQMGRFLAAYYPGQGVALNDIGAGCYYGGVDCLDLFGLASAPVLAARRRGDYNGATLERLARARNVKVALFFESWLVGAIPPGWKKAGSWRISDNCVCGSDEVSFYAADPAELARLQSCLRQFDPLLPTRVARAGY